MNNKPLVSLIIPCYNDSKYVGDCIESLINQTYDNIEIIVVNDGSTDNSQEIIDSYKAKENRIKSVIKENGGLPSARNAGLDVAKGEYISFVDSDDTLKLKAVETLISEADNDTELLVASYTEKWLYDKEITYKDEVFKNEEKYSRFLNYIDKTVIVCKNLYSKAVIDDNNLRFDEGMYFAEDYYFNINFIKSMSGSIKITSKSVYNYYLYRSSQHRRFYPDIYLYYNRILDAAESFFEGEEYKTEYKEYFAEFYFDTLFYYYTFNVKNEVEAEKYILKAFNSAEKYFSDEVLESVLSKEQYNCLKNNNANGFINICFDNIGSMKFKALIRDCLLDLKKKLIK